MSKPDSLVTSPEVHSITAMDKAIAGALQGATFGAMLTGYSAIINSTPFANMRNSDNWLPKLSGEFIYWGGVFLADSLERKSYKAVTSFLPDSIEAHLNATRETYHSDALRFAEGLATILPYFMMEKPINIYAAAFAMPVLTGALGAVSGLFDKHETNDIKPTTIAEPPTSFVEKISQQRKAELLPHAVSH